MPAVHLQENTKLISGHVAEKKGYLYWVLNITENGKRKPKWIRHIGKLGEIKPGQIICFLLFGKSGQRNCCEKAQSRITSVYWHQRKIK